MPQQWAPTPHTHTLLLRWPTCCLPHPCSIQHTGLLPTPCSTSAHFCPSGVLTFLLAGNALPLFSWKPPILQDPTLMFLWIDRVSHRLKILTSPPFQIKIFNSHAHLVPYHIFLSLKMCNHITINYPKCCAVSTYISSLYYKCPTLFQAMLIS